MNHFLLLDSIKSSQSTNPEPETLEAFCGPRHPLESLIGLQMLADVERLRL